MAVHRRHVATRKNVCEHVCVRAYVRTCVLTKRTLAVVEYTLCHVKTKSKLTKLKINSRIEGYNGK